MRFASIAVIVAIALSLAGCGTIVKITPVEKHDAIPNSAYGYIAIRTTQEKGTDIAFVVNNVDTGTAFNMPLEEDAAWSSKENKQVAIMKVPPGRYAVTQWLTYASMTKSEFTEKAVTNPVLSYPFSVNPNTVTFLGDFAIGFDINYGYGTDHWHWTIRPLHITQNDAHAAFVESYPAFRDLEFTCRLCTDTVRGLPDSARRP